ncbi:MAG: DUF370 domain-containing protein [Ruminococcus sp.]|nr:DUF370 domain-containing protein [Ruminococcus sp.]
MLRTPQLTKTHLGEGVLITRSDIIGIFDIEKTSANVTTKDFLRHLGKKAVTITYDMPKSFLVTTDKVYISKLATGVVKKRCSSYHLS